MKQCQLCLLDTQFITNHLKGFGAIEIPAQDYLVSLQEALKSAARFKSKLPDEECRVALENLLLA
jgi:Leu/Phe-tRNA-protein transferase